MAAGPTTNDDGTWKPAVGSPTDSPVRRGRGHRAAAARSFSTSESPGWSWIAWQHESQEDRCCSISSISGPSSRPWA